MGKNHKKNKMTSNTYYSSESGFFVELIEREWGLFLELLGFELANFLTVILSPWLIPYYTLFTLTSFLKSWWWIYLPTSNLDSLLPNAYAYWVYNFFFIPLPMYGQHQMYRNLLFFVTYPFLILTSPINAFLVPLLWPFVAIKVTFEVLYEKL